MKITRKNFLKISFVLLWIGFYFAYVGATSDNYVFLYISFILFGFACFCAIA